MRKFSILVSFIAAALLFVGCGGPQKMADNASLVNYTVTPDPLETHGGKVAVDINVRYPEKYFHKKAIVTATPFLRYEGGETELKSETLQGEAVEDNYKVISFTSGGSLDYSDEIDFTEAMMRSELMVRGTATVKTKSVDLPAVKIADGIISTPLLVKNNPKTIAFGDNFQRIIPENYVADIHYIINRYDVRNSELTQEDITGMKEFITTANANERIDMKGIEISAYASPDGELDLNTRLSGNRENSANRYLQRELQRSEIDIPEDEEFFSLMSTPEDWEGFKELMEASDIQDKDLILRVLSMYTDPVVREREIRNISEAFEVIKEDILPELRRSKFTVNVEKIGWSDEELVQWVKTDIDTLGLEDLLYVATLFDDNQTKLTIYEHTWEKFPGCIRAASNLGTVQLAMGRTAAAKSSFEAARKLRDHNIVKNNLGVVAMKEGDIETAENLFTSAMGAGDEVNYNLGIIKIMQGDYEAAKSYFGAAENFNNALVILLNGNAGSAVEMLRQLDDDPTGANEYLMAVAGARENDTDVMYNALRTAIAKNASWKTRAAMDVEFYQYFEEDLFRQITQ
jgi:tetratricopeptide (TPR) repeat protein